ncbi:hypothetical protein [Bacillus sp. WR11]|uniref:hypothetical protein n=1 Tax=Bacillus sp. WR11 TaxID=2448811 RepID=UPI001F0BA5F2|nr:hypothetical protein [Bacillus sp. WR11]
MKEKFIFTSIIFGYAAFFMVFIAIDHFSGTTLPAARQGVMNLEKWDFQKDGNVQLNGEWTLYPNQILSPKEIASAKGKDPLFVDVPSNVKLAKQGINVDYGTYKLTIRSKQDNQVLGSARRLYTVPIASILMDNSLAKAATLQINLILRHKTAHIRAFLRFTRVTMNLSYNFRTSEKRRDGESQSQLLLAPRSK